uniref:Uncharacterized protein n=1 Tax=Panagrolaimus superbus TaxID=310955 RepID=A0A914Z1V8_9BILA
MSTDKSESFDNLKKISSSLQNVTTSETAMKVYETGDYRGDFSQYYIGPYLDSGEPLKFKLSFDMETYRNDHKKVDPIVNKGMAEIEIVFYPTTVQAVWLYFDFM